MGNGASQLSEEQLRNLKNKTPFDEKSLAHLFKRYQYYDNSEKGTNGIDLEILMTLPEFSCHPFMPSISEIYADKRSQKIFPESFVYLCAALSSKSPLEMKKKLAFKCFDVNGTGKLKQDEIFKMYKMLMGIGISDDEIMDLVYRVLENPELKTPEEVDFQDFCKLIPDHDIASRFTIDLQAIS